MNLEPQLACCLFERFENFQNARLTGRESAFYIVPDMDEKHYRESRLCRLLGNPVVYQMVTLLDAGGAMTPSKLAKQIGRHVSTISIHLAKLRSADVVRYDTSGKEVRYWLKHKGEMKGLLKTLGRVINASAKLD